MTIMLSMLVLSATAYQLYTDSWQRDLSRIDRSYHQFRFSELLLDAMQAIIPLAVTEQGQQSFYFLGRDEGFTAVTYAPVFNLGHPAVIRVFREHNDSGGYRLVYEEASLKGIALINAGQELPFSYRQIILDNQQQLSFRYFGWKDLHSQVASQSDVSASVDDIRAWFDTFDALNRRVHPEKIKIVINGFELEFSVADRSKVNTLFNDENPI
jgi:hypothetical protein